MKARLKNNYNIDETHTLTAGAEVEITNGWCGCDGYYYNCILPDNEKMYVGGNDYAGKQIIINNNILEIIDYSPYINWEQRRYEIAKEMLHTIYIDDGNAERDDDSDLNFKFKSLQGSAREAVRFADALIEELKKAK